MGKTTNILDLNNRLTKVEKENIAQNSYTSLKNKPKINSVTLTGNKTLADIGAAAAIDVGSLSALTTTDKSSCVGAINEVNSKLRNTTIPGLYCYRAGNVVTLIYGSDDGITESGIIIPDGFRPGYQILFTGKAHINNTDIWDQGFLITSDGKLTARSSNNNSDIAVTWVLFSVTYVVMN